MIQDIVTQITNAKTHLSTRDAFGLALAEFGKLDKRIVVIDGDLSQSTRTQHFANCHPERFFNVGIAEQNMVSIGAGLATCGKIPIVVTYATFLIGRGLDQIRNMVSYCNLNVKLIGSHVGLATGEDGGTHQALEDIGVVRGLPRVVLLSPSDAVETIYALYTALNIEGPVYIRLSRENSRIIHENQYHFDYLQPEVMRDYVGAKLAIFATGTMVARALDVADLLERREIETGVINVHTIKPLATESIEKIANEVDLIITIEDHNIIGGLGTAIADVLAKYSTQAVLRKIGIEDTFGESGSVDELYSKYNLTTDSILKRIEKELETI